MFEKPGDSRPALIDSTVGKYIRTAQQRLAPQPNIAQMQQQAYQTPQQDVDALRGIGEHFTGEGPGSFAYRMYEAFPQDYQPPAPDRAWYDRAAGNVIGAAQRVGNVIGDIPISPYQSPPRSGGQQHDPRGLGESWENTAGRPIPYADKAKLAAEKYGAPAARAFPLTAFPQYLGEKLPGVPTPSGVAAGLIPQKVWELALELVPGIGTVPGAASAGRRALARTLAEEGLPLTRQGVQELVTRKTPAGVRDAILAGERGAHAPLDPLKAGDDLAGAGDDAAGGMPASAADNLPSPPEAAGRAIEQKIDRSIRDVMMEKVRQNRPLRESQSAPRSEQLAEKASKIAAVRSDRSLTPAQRAAALGKAASGEMYRADFEPLRLTPDEYIAASEHIAANPDVRDFEYLRLMGTYRGDVDELADMIRSGTGDPKVIREAISKLGALDKMRVGLGLQGNEEEMLIKAFGEDFRDVLTNRGGDSIARNIENAMTPGMEYSPIPTEQRVTVLTPELKAQQAQEQIASTTASRIRQSLTPTKTGEAPRAAFSKEVNQARDARKAILKDMQSSIEQGVTRPIDPENPRVGMSKEQVQRASLEAQSVGQRPPPLKSNRLWRAVLETLGVPRAAQATLDLSSALRQNIVGSVGHPQRYGQAFVAQMKALFSHDFAQSARREIEESEYFDVLKDRVDLTELDEPAAESGAALYKVGDDGTITQRGRVKQSVAAKLSNREEQFQSRLLEHIPGLGRLVKGSNRAFTTATNKFRWDIAYDMVRKYEDDFGHLPTEQWLYNLGLYVNNLTGRGSTKALGEHAATLNAAFFSPKFFLSRFQLAADLVRPTQSAEIRKLAAKDLGSFVATGAGFLTAMSFMPGVTVNIDPRSPDWGKYTLFGQSHDFWAGFGPIARLIAQVSAKTATGAARGELDFGAQRLSMGEVKDISWRQAVENFLYNKLSPSASLVGDTFVRERDFKYNEINAASFKKPNFENPIISRMVPLFIQDAVEAYQTGGVMGLATGAPGALLGESVSSFEPSESQEEDAVKAKDAREFTKLAEGTDAYVSGGEVRFRTLDEDEKAAVPEVIAALVPSDRPTGNFDTISELKTAVVDHLYKDYMAKNKVGASEAKAQVGNAFDALELVKNVEANIKAYRLNFWKEHPDLLDAAQLASLETLNDKERELLPARE